MRRKVQRKCARWRRRNARTASWYLALLLSANLWAGRLEAAPVSPAFAGGPGCIDFWIVSTRHLPANPDPATAVSQLAVWHREPSGWMAYRYDAFVAAIDSDVPVCFYLNGIFTSAESATNDSQNLFAKVGAGMPPFRGVHWLWPSDFDAGVALREQVNRALARSQAESYYLALTIQSLHATPEINLVGHSFGCQIAAETLTRLGRCRIASTAAAREPCGTSAARLKAALIAPTIGPCSLLPGGPFETALACVDRLLITHNPEDVALHAYEQIQERQALGVTGLPAVASGWRAKVIQVDAGPAVHFRHAAAIYFASPLVAEWLRGFVGGT